MDNETHQRLCKVCHKVKLRIYDGVYSNGKDKIWIDESRRQWNGACCPECNVIRSKEIMRKKRLK